MTVLAELGRGLRSVQCDLCVPPVLTSNTVPDLRRTGWALREDGGPWDVCPVCAVRTAPRDRSPRGDRTPVSPDPGRLPNVVVVGATKAGTTSMHQYLGQHPDIGVPAEKEMRFFTDPDCRDWLGTYQACFPAGTAYRLESTPFYTKSPVFPGVVDRMAELVPDARVIYLVRDPLERIVAEYAEQMQWWAATRSLEEELADPDEPGNWLVASSRYATQLREYLRRFDRDQIMVIDQADLAADAVHVLGRVLDFLDLPPLAQGAAQLSLHNTREDKKSYPPWVRALWRGPVVRTLRRLPEGWRSHLSTLAWQRLRTAVRVPELGEREALALRGVLGPEVAALRELTGQEYATWTL